MCLLVIASSCVNQPVAAVTEVPLNTGPLVQELVFKVIGGDDNQVLALINDEADLIGDMVDPSHLSTLESAANIEVAETLRNGYAYLTIKTDKYPLNITDFRRAFAIAFDKEKICEEAWDGLAVPQDSLVPQQNPFSVEGQLPYTYYEANVALGNQLLDAAGFLDDDSDGFREAPNGSDFDIVVEVDTYSTVSSEVGETAAETLQALDIDAVCVQTDFYDYLNRLWLHGDYDMVFLGASFTTFDINWLAYEYWGDYADEPYWNFPCWRNTTYDSWRNQLLHSTSYSQVYQAAIEMQKIWIHACPVVVCYQNKLLSAYRTDKFEGQVNDALDGTPSWWTNYKVHLKGSPTEPPTGQFRWSTPLDVDTFNFMATFSAYSWNVLASLYDSLIICDPEGNDMPWLAESYTIQTHSDNASIPAGHMRIIFNLVPNAVWTNYFPLTAYDVAFTLNYYADAPGNPYGADLAEMTTAYASDYFTVIVDFETESFWHLHTVGYKPIIPMYVFAAIGPSGWNSWNPSWDDLVTSGPFTISDYVAGEFTELSYNPLYFHAFSIPPSIDHPVDITYAVNSTGNTIVWNPSDANPALYMVLRNNTLIESGFWNGSDITVSIDGLAVGTYNFTLWVFDWSANYANDTVWVHVYAPTGIPIEMIAVAAAAGAAVVVVLIGWALMKSKRGANG